MVKDIGFEPLDERTLESRIARAGFLVDGEEISQILPLANELLEMSSELSAFVGRKRTLSPIYVVDKTQANGDRT